MNAPTAANSPVKKYWARIVYSRGEYGSWVPTDATTLEAAMDYIRNYHDDRWVREWLLL